MKWYLTTQKQSYGTYYLYKRNYTQEGKPKSDYVYLGTEQVALKILSDFNSEKPKNERLLSFSGECLLSKVLEMVGFKNVVNKTVRNGTKFDIGRFIEMLVIELVLYEHSKWGVANLSHAKSIFSLDQEITPENFYENNIYHYMDYLYPMLDKIQKEIIKRLLSIKNVEFDELIIDATSMHCFGSDEIEEPRNQMEKYKQIKRIHGYSRSKRPDLPQINLILGVTNYYLPLLFDAFSGNAPDTAMFSAFLEKCQKEYPMLLKKVKGKYLVFDKGNNSETNFKELDALCEKWNCHMVTSVRPSLVSVKDQLVSLTIEELPVIYEQQHTKLRGKTSTVYLYEGDLNKRKILFYVNEEIALKKQGELKKLLNDVQEKVREINQKKGNVEEKMKLVETMLRNKKVISYFKRGKDNETITCAPIQAKMDEKFNLAGKFAIVTSDDSLDANSIIRIYKMSGVIEQEFHVLKSVLSLYPLRHRKPDRIKVHCALVIWGAMAFALLRYQLMQQGFEFTFETLKHIVKEGYMSIGDYIYPDYKSFRIQRTLNVNPLLKDIFKVFALNFDYFDITLLPTINTKKGTNE